MRPEKKSADEQFAENIISMLEAGTAPWQRSWDIGQALSELTRCDDMVQHVLSLVLYLCSESPEWKSQDSPDPAPHYAEPKKVKTGWRLFPPDRPRIWTVGEETGIRIRSGLSRGEGAHTGKRPHIRRAHWHSYWTGRKVWKEGETPEPQKLMVKWLPPIPVAMQDEE